MLGHAKAQVASEIEGDSCSTYSTADVRRKGGISNTFPSRGHQRSMSGRASLEAYKSEEGPHFRVVLAEVTRVFSIQNANWVLHVRFIPVTREANGEAFSVAFCRCSPGLPLFFASSLHEKCALSLHVVHQQHAAGRDGSSSDMDASEVCPSIEAWNTLLYSNFLGV